MSKVLLKEYANMPMTDPEINEIIKTIPELQEWFMFSVDHIMTSSQKRRYKSVLDFARAIEKAHRIGD
jgi:hypothetical protein